MDGVGVAIAETLIKIVRGYLFAGLLFSVPFVIFGIQRVDPSVKGWNVLFRVLILPGLSVFWPLFAVRLVRGKRHPVERNAHRLAAQSASNP